MSNISYFAIRTLSLQKIKEFFFEFQHTIVSPIISNIIFIIILSTISHYYGLKVNNISYIEFLVPGIILMTVMQVSYSNISESLIHMKQIGCFNDYLVSPMSRTEILISLVGASTFIGIFIGIINIFLIKLFINFDFINYLVVIYYLFLISLIFSSLGAITGFVSFTWDFQQSIYSFFIVPLSFFSGTFFSIETLSSKWSIFLMYNPFYQIVNNFRNSFNNSYYLDFQKEIFILFFSLIFFYFSLFIYKKGYRVIN